MNAALFSYGSLMFEPVRRLHSARALAAEPAVLAGFSRHALRGAGYPGIVPAPGESVAGVLVRGISPALLARLDRWEGDEYVRVPVRVALASGATSPAFAYVLAPRARARALPQDWDPQAFASAGLTRWLHDARYRNALRNSRRGPRASRSRVLTSSAR